MTDTAYMSIHGLDISTIVDVDGVSVSGGGRKIDSYSTTGMDYAEVVESGRESLTYTFQMMSSTRTDIERARQELNNTPEGAEFCPYTEDQVAYVEQAYAMPSQSTKTYSGRIYYSDATVVCRDGLLYSATEGGIQFVRNPALPQTATITNSGGYSSGIDSLIMSGKYVYGSDCWTAGVEVSIGDESLSLCDYLLGGDRFAVDRFGNCDHSWETAFHKLYAETQNDLMGSTYFDYGTGGSMTDGNLLIGNSGKLMIPFYGPLAAANPPVLEFEVTDIYSSPEVSVAYASDLSDIEALDCDPLIVGENTIYLSEDTIGESLLVVGITTDSGSQIRLSSFKASVERYISPKLLPTIDPDESETLTVSDADQSNHTLSYLLATYRDIY